MVISNDDAFERAARSVHDCGRLPGEWFYSHFSYGSNYRLSEWQGVILTAQWDVWTSKLGCVIRMPVA